MAHAQALALTRDGNTAVDVAATTAMQCTTEFHSTIYEAGELDGGDASSASEDVNDRSKFAFYYVRRYEPYCQNATMTLLGMIYMLQCIRIEKHMNDEAFKLVLCVLSTSLPVGHILPGTIYLANRLVGLHDMEDVERHACVCGYHCWDHLPHEQWWEHRADECPICHTSRFVEKQKKMKPRQVRWLDMNGM